MKNKKGQSLIDVIFSIAMVVLVLTGVVVLIVSTAKVKRVAFERSRAIELSQKIIDAEVKKVKDDPLSYWSSAKNDFNGTDSDFPGYDYRIQYDCDIVGGPSDNCSIIFNINWGDNQSLSVERFFSRRGI